VSDRKDHLIKVVCKAINLTNPQWSTGTGTYQTGTAFRCFSQRCEPSDAKMKEDNPEHV